MSDAILDKVRKLLTKAEDPGCTPAEAAAFTAKATDLIARYGVDQALLAARRSAADPVTDRKIEVSRPYAAEKASLLAAVAGGLRCRTVRLRTGHRTSVHVFGFDSDLARVELLYTSLLVQAAHGLAAASVPPWEHPAAFRRTWLIGFAQSVAHRLRRAEEAAVAASAEPSTTLVLADRSVRVERRRDEAYPDAEPMRQRRLSGGGLYLGAAAGRRADLGGERLTGAGAARQGIGG
ncbi:DUF2786 domain-containing protein [Plantactinospora sp. GCM10030261]|uniref:DUF2786 domain-containing protein n=1 Tax=Plantactinospora sp. GCM10030261 TaxID=3273420 RepID=UPI003624361C